MYYLSLKHQKIVLSFICCFFLNSCDDNAALSEEDQVKLRTEIVLAEALEHIRDECPQMLSETQLIEGAINGMLRQIDPYSSYLPAHDYLRLNKTSRGEFGGIGLEVIPTKQGLQVIAALNNTPAQKAKILSGEYIIKINNEDIIQKNFSDVIDQFHGKPGSSILLHVMNDQGAIRTVSMTRALITIPTLTSCMYDQIAYIGINVFHEKTSDTLEKTFDRLIVQNDVKGLILDLRNNPGGILEEAVSCSGLFLDKSLIVSTKGRLAEDARDYITNGPDHARGLPIVVLINKGSASGAEIMAAALKEHKRAILIGDKTFGKGSVQTVYPLSNQGALKLTTAYFFSPKHNAIHKTGVDPDYHVTQASDDKIGQKDKDTQLKAALDFFHGLMAKTE